MEARASFSLKYIFVTRWNGGPYAEKYDNEG